MASWFQAAFIALGTVIRLWGGEFRGSEKGSKVGRLSKSEDGGFREKVLEVSVITEAGKLFL